MKKKIKINENTLKKIVAESVKRALKESAAAGMMNKPSNNDKDYIIEKEVLLSDRKIFGDNEEHCYNVKCYDGHAIAVLADKKDNAPRKIELTYPRKDEVLRNEEMAQYVLKYRGLDRDLGFDDITYGDVMMALGKIRKSLN